MKSAPSDSCLPAEVAAAARARLPDFLARQRWFGGKAEPILSCEWRAVAALPQSEHGAWLTLLDVTQPSGAATYLLALAIAAPHPALPEQALLSPLASGLWVIDGLWDDDVCRALGRLLYQAATLPAGAGRIQFTRSLDGWPAESADAPPAVRRLGAEQSNTSLILGDEAVLKCFRRLSPGVNPDYEVGRHLRERAGFSGTPAVLGAIEYAPADAAEPWTLAIAQSFIPRATGGWEWMLARLADWFGANDGAELGGPDECVRQAARLGRVTAALHRALAGDAHAEAFAPIPWNAEEWSACRARLLGRLAATWERLREIQTELQPAAQPAGRVVLARSPADLVARLAHCAPVELGWRTRCHGDYHLGQVLLADDAWWILDFEGEPVRSLAERRSKESPLKDVAGMLRSFDYAAQVAFRTACAAPEQVGATAVERLTAAAGAWRAATSAAFLQAYRAELPRSAPPQPTAFAGLLDFYLLEKAAYELDYELRFRPQWAAVPLCGLARLVGE